MTKRHYTHIHDGFTRKGFINGLNERGQRLSGELRFTYRPMLAGQRDSFRTLISGEKNAQKADMLFASAMATHLVDWTAETEGGTPVPVNVENVRRLPPFLYDRIYYVISGSEPSDPEPEPQSPEDDTYAAQLKAAADSGAAPGDLQTGAQQKN